MFVRVTLQQFLENFKDAKDVERLLLDVLAGVVEFDYRAPSGSKRTFQLSSHPGKLYTPVFVGFSVDDYITCYRSQRWDVLRVLFASADEQHRQDEDVKTRLQSGQQEFLSYLNGCEDQHAVAIKLEHMIIHHPNLLVQIYSAAIERDDRDAFLSSLAVACRRIAYSEQYESLQRTIKVNAPGQDNPAAQLFVRTAIASVFDEKECGQAQLDHYTDVLLHNEFKPEDSAKFKTWIQALAKAGEPVGLFSCVQQRMQRFVGEFSREEVLVLLRRLQAEEGMQTRAVERVMHDVFAQPVAHLLFNGRLDRQDWGYCYELVFRGGRSELSEDAVTQLKRVLLSGTVDQALKLSIVNRFFADERSAELYRVGVKALVFDSAVWQRFIEAVISDADTAFIVQIMVDMVETGVHTSALDQSQLRSLLLAILKKDALSPKMHELLFSLDDSRWSSTVFSSLFNGEHVSELFMKLIQVDLQSDATSVNQIRRMIDWLKHQYEVGSRDWDLYTIHSVASGMAAAFAVVDDRGEITSQGIRLVEVLDDAQLPTLLRWYRRIPSALICQILNCKRMSLVDMVTLCVEQCDKAAINTVIKYNANSDGGEQSSGVDTSAASADDELTLIASVDNCALVFNALWQIHRYDFSNALLSALFERSQALGQTSEFIKALESQYFLHHVLVWRGFGIAGSRPEMAGFYKYVLQNTEYLQRLFNYSQLTSYPSFFASDLFAACSTEELAQCMWHTYEGVLTHSTQPRFSVEFDFLLKTLRYNQNNGAAMIDAAGICLDGCTLLHRMYKRNIVALGDEAQQYNKRILLSYYDVTGGKAMPESLLEDYLDRYKDALDAEFVGRLLRQSIIDGDHKTTCMLIDRCHALIDFDSLYQSEYEKESLLVEPQTVLYFALKANINDDVLMRLLLHTQKLDFRSLTGRSALHLAVQKRNYKAMYDLLKFKSVRNSLDDCDDDGNTALSLAIDAKDRFMVHTLLAVGVAYGSGCIDCSKQFGLFKRNVLHMAVISGSVDVLSELLQHNECRRLIHVVDGQGMTPLSLACATSNMDIAKLLLQAGAQSDRAMTLGSMTAVSRFKQMVGVERSEGFMSARYYANHAGCLSEFTTLLETTPVNPVTQVDASMRAMKAERDDVMEILSEQFEAHDHTRSHLPIREALYKTLCDIGAIPLKGGRYQFRCSVMDVVSRLADQRYRVAGGREHSFLSTASRNALEELGYRFQNFPVNGFSRFFSSAYKVAADVCSMLDPDYEPAYDIDFDAVYASAERVATPVAVSALGAKSEPVNAEAVAVPEQFGKDGAEGTAEPIVTAQLVADTSAAAGSDVLTGEVIGGYYVPYAMPVNEIPAKEACSYAPAVDATVAYAFPVSVVPDSKPTTSSAYEYPAASNDASLKAVPVVPPAAVSAAGEAEPLSDVAQPRNPLSTATREDKTPAQSVVGIGMFGGDTRPVRDLDELAAMIRDLPVAPTHNPADDRPVPTAPPRDDVDDVERFEPVPA